MRVRTALTITAYSAVSIAAGVAGLRDLGRMFSEAADNWPLSYEGTPEADAEMATHAANAHHALNGLMGAVFAEVVATVVMIVVVTYRPGRQRPKKREAQLSPYFVTTEKSRR
jgi:hypothetical protein